MSRIIMTVVLIVVVLGIVFAATGVLRFQNTRDESTITIDKKELKESTREAVEKSGEVGGRLLDKTGETLHKAAERMRGSSSDGNTPTAVPSADDQGTQPDGGKKPRDDKIIH